jgi:hypothetical protein
MKLTAINSATGEEFSADAEAVTEESIRDLFDIDLSDDALKRMINNLNVSADVKSLLFSVAKTTVLVGQKVLKIGKKVFAIIKNIIDDFPNMTTGAIICTVLSVLVSSIPILGFIFGPLLGPLLIAFGIVIGTLEDLKDKALQRRITKTVADFETLKTESA